MKKILSDFEVSFMKWKGITDISRMRFRLNHKHGYIGCEYRDQNNFDAINENVAKEYINLISNYNSRPRLYKELVAYFNGESYEDFHKRYLQERKGKFDEPDA